MSFGGNLKKIRKQLALSLRELSQISNVSKTMLSEIETGKKTPTITVACKIAGALGISLTTLMDSEENEEISIIRKEERISFIDPKTLIIKQLVSPTFASFDVEINFVTIPAGTTTGLVPPQKNGRKEYLVLTKGSVQVKVGQNVCELKEGDSIYFEAHYEHEIVNPWPTDAEFFLVDRKTVP